MLWIHPNPWAKTAPLRSGTHPQAIGAGLLQCFCREDLSRQGQITKLTWLSARSVVPLCSSWLRLDMVFDVGCAPSVPARPQTSVAHLRVLFQRSGTTQGGWRGGDLTPCWPFPPQLCE